MDQPVRGEAGEIDAGHIGFLVAEVLDRDPGQRVDERDHRGTGLAGSGAIMDRVHQFQDPP